MSSNSFLGRIGSYLFGNEVPEPASDTPAAVKARRAAVGAMPAKLPAGSLQLIGLGSIQHALGAAWPEQAEQIHRMIDGILRRRLDETDAFYKVDGENYLILFARLGRREAEFKARVISEEIQTQVFGMLLPGHELTVLSAVADVDRGIVLEKTGSLAELLTYVRGATVAETDAITLFKRPVSGQVTPNAAPVVGAGPDMADLDQPLSGLFHKKTVAGYLKECRAGFYPAFSLKRRSFSSFQTAILHEPSGKLAGSESDPFLDAPEDLPFQLDRFALTAGLLGAQRMLTSGRQGVVMIPVGFNTLAVSKLRETYLLRLKEVPSGVAKYIGIMIRDIPSGTMASRVAELISYVQPYCHSRLLRLAPDARLIELYADTGCHGFATWVPDEVSDATKPFHALSGFTKRAALHRLDCILTEIPSHDVLSTGIAAGFTYFSGEGVAGMIETPGVLDGVRIDHIQRQGGTVPLN